MTGKTRKLSDLQERDAPTVLNHDDYACRNTDTELFFPPEHGNPAPAQAICRRCPHRRECLDWALDTRQQFGIWGGLTPEQRRRIIHLRLDAAS